VFPKGVAVTSFLVRLIFGVFVNSTTFEQWSSHRVHGQTHTTAGTMFIPRSARRFLETLGPYQSLLVLAVPLAIVELFKLVALL
jgi:hypothetical protein